MKTPSMNARKLLSMNLAYCQASGGYSPEMVNKEGEFDVSGLQMEVNSHGELTGRFKSKRGGEAFKPVGEWLDNWLDELHARVRRTWD